MKLLSGIILGALAGTAAGILLAPKSGEQTRKGIKKETDKFKKNFDKSKKNFEKSLQGSLDELRKSFNETIDKVASGSKNTINKAKDTAKV